jgi:hypothetical protein
MSKRLFKGLLVLGCAAFMSMPALSAPSSGGCASVGVQTSPDTVSVGYSVGIYGSINNCSSGRKRYTIIVSAMSDCGQKTTVASFRQAFKPGENRMYGVSYAISPDTCAGPSTVTVEVLEGGGAQASATTSFTIVN